MHVLDARHTAEMLPWAGLVQALREMLLRRHAGETDSPERLAVPLPGGTLLVMPASDGEYASVKLATLHDGNAACGLPTKTGSRLQSPTAAWA